eukprot:CAMPEP_0116935210 /NCGR_PEP_ID=MMETSP0467-20121206/30129_1 /TAXON_ID=283647 /ORGANISM="Mesodinium pulex, Strain SPMC105" /LENGTH=104 /DNA_ID=CAMNT_0004616503 /DNA_START=297 /DNA_END=611 /DNA_ORIENTATION=-
MKRKSSEENFNDQELLWQTQTKISVNRRQKSKSLFEKLNQDKTLEKELEGLNDELDINDEKIDFDIKIDKTDDIKIKTRIPNKKEEQGDKKDSISISVSQMEKC